MYLLLYCERLCVYFFANDLTCFKKNIPFLKLLYMKYLKRLLRPNKEKNETFSRFLRSIITN